MSYQQHLDEKVHFTSIFHVPWKITAENLKTLRDREIIWCMMHNDCASGIVSFPGKGKGWVSSRAAVVCEV